MKLSIIIPVFNEEQTIKKLLEKIFQVPLELEKEIIVINDGSTDKSEEILEGLKKGSKFVLLAHQKNRGKGAAIKTGLKSATGDLILVQDADLEYDPNDYLKLIAPFLEKGASVVYGSRNLKKNQISSPAFYLGGRFLTSLFNLLFRTELTFNFCEEVSAKVIKKGYKIIEVPINYFPRKKKEGKKINWLDGLRGFWAIIKYRF